jgi:hypothetical protein
MHRRGGLMSMRRARAKRREALDRAAGDQQCAECGRVLEGLAAYQVHRDGGSCLPDGAAGQLVLLRDGRWALRWRHPEVRDG